MLVTAVIIVIMYLLTIIGAYIYLYEAFFSKEGRWLGIRENGFEIWDYLLMFNPFCSIPMLIDWVLDKNSPYQKY